MVVLHAANLNSKSPTNGNAKAWDREPLLQQNAWQQLASLAMSHSLQVEELGKDPRLLHTGPESFHLLEGLM